MVPDVSGTSSAIARSARRRTDRDVCIAMQCAPPATVLLLALSAAAAGPTDSLPGLAGPADSLPVTTGRPADALSAGTPRGTGLRIRPYVSITETLTDNVGLTPNGQSDFITQITPGFLLDDVGPRANIHIDYSIQNNVYIQDSSRNSNNQQLLGAGHAELAKNLFFVDAAATIRQENISLLGPISSSNVNTTGNLGTVHTYSLSPYLKHRFGTEATGEVRYTFDRVQSSGGDLTSSNGNRLNATLLSGSAFHNWGWGLNYDKQKTDYQSAQSFDTETVGANARFHVRPKFDLLATGGYEDNNFITTGSKPKGAFWSAGGSWTPSLLTSLSATVGRRYFGKTYSLNAAHRGPHSNWTLSYGQDLVTTRGQFLVPASISTVSVLDALLRTRIPNPAERNQIIQDLIAQGLPATIANPINFFSNEVFLEKRLQASVALDRRRSVWVLTAFDVVRDSQSRGQASSLLLGNSDFSTSGSIKQRGAGAVWSVRLAPLTTANLSANYSREDFVETGREDKIALVSLGVSRQFNSKVSGTVNYRRVQRDSTQSGSGYRENALTGTVNIFFQ
jgi:uncharacterized protein (PEP-CTERM system associated)